MQDSSTPLTAVLQFRQDLQAKLRDGVRRAIETVEELLAALGADDHVRTPMRRGYRHGTTERTLTTREGTRTITVPRARLRGPDGRIAFTPPLRPATASRTTRRPYPPRAPASRPNRRALSDTAPGDSNP